MTIRYFVVEIDDEQLALEEVKEDSAINSVLSALEHFDIPSTVIETKYDPLMLRK